MLHNHSIRLTSAVIVGLVGGLGDFLGYALRLISGFLADTTRAYWFFIFLGYGLIVSIPLLGFSTSLEIAIILVLLERLGKAFRSPARDTVLSVISKGVGAGKAFGIHELLDQTGAIAGPLIVTTLMFSSGNNYRYTFTFLLIPFLGLLIALVCTYKKIRAKAIIETRKAEEKKENLSKPFYTYIFAVLLNTSGLIPYTLILYKASMILPTQEEWIVPLIYRAAVSDLTPISIRGTAYGIFNTAYGAGISGSFIYLLLGRDFEVGIKFI